MKKFKIRLATALVTVFGLTGCGSMQTCHSNNPNNNQDAMSGPVCQMQPGHEPRALQGVSGL